MAASSLRGLGELGVQFGDEPRHLLLERLAVVLDFLGADVAAGREHVAVLRDLVCRRGLAEAGDVGVSPSSIALCRRRRARRDRCRRSSRCPRRSARGARGR